MLQENAQKMDVEPPEAVEHNAPPADPQQPSAEPLQPETPYIHPIYVNIWKSEFEELCLYKDLLDNIIERNRQTRTKVEAYKKIFLHTIGDKIIRRRLEAGGIPALKNIEEYFPAATVHQKELLAKIQSLRDEMEFSIHKPR